MTHEAMILLAVLLPVIGAFITPFFVKRLRNNVGLLAMCFPIASLLTFSHVANKVGWGHATLLTMPWVSELRIDLSFLLDGVSLFFGFVVCIMGALVCLYAKSYLHENIQQTGRFFSYLLVFMTAMLGTVFSDNIFLMFIFWEITGVASFLLISFYFDEEKSQKGALMALIVTGATGLVMFAGLLILYNMLGSMSIFNLITIGPKLTSFQPALILPFVLIMIGAFGKSAQFPFHFWLPNAMSAPTPISAYLHSAAMVKLGVFLTARFYPVFVENELFAPLLITVGITTMVLGAIFSILTHDIKGLLAYTTISQLGFLFAFYGMGSVTGVEHDFFHILNHVFYKGSLFMVAGIVIHGFHTQDIRKMGGYFKFAPIAGIAAVFSVLAMGGIPGTTGFLSKELMLETILHTAHNGGLYRLLPVAIMISAVCLIVAGLRFLKIFFGPLKGMTENHLSKPSILFQLPAFVLSVCVVVFGLFPGILESALNTLSVYGLHSHHPHHIKIWHGITTPLLMSVSAIFSAIILFILANKAEWRFSNIPSAFRFDFGFNRLLQFIQITARFASAITKLESATYYLPVIFTSFILIIGYFLFPIFETKILPYLINFDQFSYMHGAIVLLIALSAYTVILATNWMTRLVAISVVGFLISFYFILYKAPDLALTQIMIEAVGIVLVLMLLARFPKTSHKEDNQRSIFCFRKVINIIISIGMGVTMMSLVALMTNDKLIAPIADYYIQTTNTLAGGSNAVNTILVDYRGFDTMGEISVLVIALLGILGLLWKRLYPKTSLEKENQ